MDTKHIIKVLVVAQLHIRPKPEYIPNHVVNPELMYVETMPVLIDH